MTQLPDTLAARLEAVRETIVAACARANRPADSVTLVAVSKTHPPDALLEAIACGQTHFGENRIEEGADKITAVKARSSVPLTWHMIGHVQSRKARDVIATFDYVHSMDSLKLEMNVSGEDSKSGFSAEHWHNDSNQRESLWNDIRRIIELPGIVVRGLMTMAPIVEQPEAARPTFSALRELRNKLAADFSTADWSALSMGMTDDYAIAIEEGATIVRVGRAIFGPREMV
jgi:pyridoxal phosphate enzyme (YggS family)